MEVGGSSVMIVTELRAGEEGDCFSIPGSSRFFVSYPETPDRVQGRPKLPFNGHHRIFFWRVKRFLLSIAKVEDAWSCKSTCP